MEESEGGPVAEDVRRRILSMLAQGTLHPGSRLGSEREMAERFAVSRATVRSALVPLSRAGILERQTGRGGGTFVRADVVQRNVAELVGLPTRLHIGGHTSDTRVLGTSRRPATAAERAALEIAEGAEVFDVRRLRYADGVPLSVDTAYFPAELVPDLLEQPLGDRCTSCARCVMAYKRTHRRKQSKWSAPTRVRPNGLTCRTAGPCWLSPG